jgi:glycosyltransferase involved in cell wall biosynthesis
MLSVLIPTYNYNIQELVKLLSYQLSNVDFDYEILVLDDCSTRQDLITSNQNITNLPNCFFYRNDNNLGRTATRQKLAKLAKFDYLLFMDADVLPKNNDFIKNIDIKKQTNDVVFGGVSYSGKKPEPDQMLRWKYGSARETKSVQERNLKPYLSIISQCFLIKKALFVEVNGFLHNQYGLDVLFSQKLENKKATIQHIDNPIIHFGLETNKAFIEKTIKGLKTLFELEQSGDIPNNYRPIQKARLLLRRYKLSYMFTKLIGLFEQMILKNLNGHNPSLFIFDVYRLYIYQKMFQ